MVRKQNKATPVQPFDQDGGDMDSLVDNLAGLLSDDLTIAGSEEADAEVDRVESHDAADAADDEAADTEETDDAEEDEEAAEPEEDVEDDEESEEEESELDEEDEESDSDTAEELYEVKSRGEVKKVTLAELKEYYSKGDDYTHKTQQTAERRREADEELELARQERAEYGQRLDALGQALANAMPTAPDWEKLRRENPNEYLLQRADYDRAQEKLQKVAEERARVYQREQEDQQRQIQRTVQREAERLVEAIPEWSDEKVAKAEREALIAHGLARGFTEDELKSVVDHRTILVLRDAMRYREMTTKGKERLAEKKSKSKSLTMKPGKGKSTLKPSEKKGRDKAVKRAQGRLRKSGSVDDAAAAIYASLDDDLL